MSEPTVTLTLLPAVYDELSQRAREHHRRVEDEAAATLSAAVGAGALVSDLEATSKALRTLDDEALWRVSLTQPTIEDGVLLDALADKRRRQKLSRSEEELLAELVDRHDRVMALRAEAIAQLHERGIDVRERVPEQLT